MGWARIGLFALVALVAGGMIAWWALSTRSVGPARGVVETGRNTDRDTRSVRGASADRPSAAVLTAIRELEATQDPKCHSTASRFENFIYGTPLTAEAREAKVALQKELVRRIRRDAAAHAAAAGRSAVAQREVREAVERVVRTTAADNDMMLAHFADIDPIAISPVRARQMASIAYSLRAILSVEQDMFLGDASAAPPLESSSIEPLREAIDTVTLAALQLADAESRRANEPTISAEQLRTSWRRLVPEPLPAASAAPSISSPDSVKRREDELRRQLFSMIDGKMEAYEAYNETTPSESQRRFLKNVKDYYALYKTPVLDQWIKRLMNAYNGEMAAFAGRLVTRAAESADPLGRVVLRSADATAAVAQLLPHLVDDFEDVTIFPNLRTERITLESYDCDSFRDTGFHWRFLRSAYEADAEALPPDPFAAEILTEAISIYGVLLLRVAGRVAQERQDAPALRPHHLEEARRRIIAWAKSHHERPSRSAGATAIRSADTAPSRDTAGDYFTDVTERLGVAYEHDSTRWLHNFRRDSVSSYPTFSGGGVAAEDIDGDGHIDLLFVGGGGNALFWGHADGSFREETPDAITFTRPDGTHAEARQPLIADFDNDGQQDIFISYAGDDHQLLRNIGERQFEDVTAAAGLGGAGLVSGPATTFDFDDDGLLDLYITGFGDYVNGAIPRQWRNNTNALPNKLFRNLGGMKFEDVTEGSATDDTGWCQAVSHTDFDSDGRQDIVVANDFGRNALLRNLGDGRFKNVASALGHTKAYHSMNVGVTDLNRDGFPDIYISNIATMVKDNKYIFPDVNTPQKLDLTALSNMLVKEANVLYMSRAVEDRLARHEPSVDIERGESSTGWSWDAEFFDFDNDGDDDLYVTNGTNDYNIFSRVVILGDRATGQVRHIQLDNRREANVFYVNDGGQLKNRSAKSGADFAANSRSTAYLDWDNDGDLDIAVANFQSPAVMLQNNSRENHWIKVRLVGDPAKKTNRDAIGARIVATNDEGLYLVREVQGGSGYLSQNPKEQHFGLGMSERVDLTIHWPGGEVQWLTDLAADRRHVIRQGKGEH